MNKNNSIKGFIYGAVLAVSLTSCANNPITSSNAEQSRIDKITKSVEAAHKDDAKKELAQHAAEQKATIDKWNKEEKEYQQSIINNKYRYLKDAGKPVTITNNNSNPSAPCHRIVTENKSWIPGGWTVNCVDNLNSKDMESSRTTGVTYPNTKTINLLNSMTGDQVQEVFIHELAHSYDFTYFGIKEESEIAHVFNKTYLDYFTKPYETEPGEAWARGYSTCYSGFSDGDGMAKLDCSNVNKIINEVKKKLGVNIRYVPGGKPTPALNERKNVPAMPTK